MCNHKSELHPMAFTDLTMHIQTRHNSNGKCTLCATGIITFLCGVGFKPNTKIYRKIHLQTGNDTMQYNSNHVRQPVVQFCNRHRLARRRLAYCCWKRNIDSSNIKFCFFFSFLNRILRNYLTLKSNGQFAQKFHHVRWDVRPHHRLI